jgi:hypothetical protein
MLVQSYGIAVPRAQKVNFPFHTTPCVNTALKVQETVITRDFIGGTITNSYRFLFVPNKVPNLPNEKALPNSMFKKNVKKMDYIKQFMR